MHRPTTVTTSRAARTQLSPCRHGHPRCPPAGPSSSTTGTASVTTEGGRRLGTVAQRGFPHRRPVTSRVRLGPLGLGTPAGVPPGCSRVSSRASAHLHFRPAGIMRTRWPQPEEQMDSAAVAWLLCARRCRRLQEPPASVDHHSRCPVTTHRGMGAGRGPDNQRCRGRPAVEWPATAAWNRAGAGGRRLYVAR